MTGTDVATYTRERPGVSAFVLEDGVVYHTYSAYARGVDGLWSMYQWLDRTPRGRNESGIWWRRHDERSEEHTSELQSLAYLVCRLLLEKKKKKKTTRAARHSC